MSIDRAIQAIADFHGLSLTQSLSTIESSVVGLGTTQLEAFCGSRSIDSTFISLAASIKKVAGQINVIIHAAGILCSLPRILKPGEVVESVSLGAGNTGRQASSTAPYSAQDCIVRSAHNRDDVLLRWIERRCKKVAGPS